MAKRICRTADRLDQTGMPGLCHRVWRAAPLPSPQIVSKILQRGSHALIAEKGCAGFARCPGCWPRSLPTDPGRIAPSIRPDLISGRDKGQQASLILDMGRKKLSRNHAFFPVAVPCFWMNTLICSRSEVVADVGLNPRHAFRKSKS